MIEFGCIDYDQNELDAVANVIRSGIITSGPVMQSYESEFASLHRCRYGLMVNSGTDALRIALTALKEIEGWKDGDEVIVPTLTFISTANIVFQAGMKPVFVDVLPDTFCINPDLLHLALTPHTRAIIPVHLFGLPANMAQIASFAEAFGLRVIEDSCESVGVKENGRPVGSRGDVGCFSTYAAHVITTGVGGIAITNDSHTHRIMRSLANHGRDPVFLGYADSRTLNPLKYRTENSRRELINARFRFERIGYSSRATQLEAALGLAQLKKLPRIIERRQRNFRFLHDHLSGLEGVRFQSIPADRQTAAMMFPMVVDHRRDAILLALEANDIEARPFFNILAQAPYRGQYDENDYPVAKFLSANGLFVGCHQKLMESELFAIVDGVKEALAGAGEIGMAAAGVKVA